MASITVRNIPDEVLKRLKALSSIDRRSLNNEILMILERGTFTEYEEKLKMQKAISKTTQIEIWKAVSGKWVDDRSTEEIIKDIYSHRTIGRDIKL
jgi:plasmid stability protein